MHNLLTTWIRDTFRSTVSKRKRTQATGSLGFECLETRMMLDVTLSSIAAQQIEAGKNLYIPLTGVDSTQTQIQYTVTSSNSNVTATVLTGNPSLKMTVSGTDSSNQAFSGTLTFQLFQNYAPATVAQIQTLVNQGFYNGLIFHRVINNFVAQGGDPTGTGSGGSGSNFSDEYNTKLTYNSVGLLGLANSGHDTNSSQFFITDSKSSAPLPEHLNFVNGIFGILTSGFDTFQKLITTPVDSGNRPTHTATMSNVQMFTDTQNGVLQISEPANFTGTSNIQVTGTGSGTPATQSFAVTAVADTVNDRAILGPISSTLTTNQNTPVSFTVTGTDMELDQLTFVVKTLNGFDSTVGGNANNTGSAPANVAVNIQVTPATSSTPATATITLTPNTNFTGSETLVVGVRDQTNRATSPGTLDSLSNFDTQKFTLTVTPTVNTIPQATAGSSSAPQDASTPIQLAGNSGDPGTTQTITYQLATQPQHGTITNFNANTGALTYTPLTGYTGPDSFTFTVQDNAGTANGGQDTSAPATYSLNVTAPRTVPLDINPAGVSNARDYTVVSSGLAFFAAQDANGNGLYKTDGTANGTVLVKEFGTSSSSMPSQLTNVNGTLFFVVDDGTHGKEIWTSNGTDAGTTLLLDVVSGSDSSSPANLTNVNGTLFFTANDGAHGSELWSSNGTTAGTALLKDVRNGTSSSRISQLTNVNGTLFFSADDGTHGLELWSSNGTAAGTTNFFDIRTGVKPSVPSHLTNVNGRLFFLAYDNSHGWTLWSSNGTVPGTAVVKQFPQSGKASHLHQFTNVNGTLFFTTYNDDDEHGSQLWMSNGTAAGTKVLRDFAAPNHRARSPVAHLTELNGNLYFIANDQGHGTELWMSNGTTGETELVKDILPGKKSSGISELTNVNGTLYFKANNGADGTELWKSNGTSDGTELVSDLAPGVASSLPSDLTNFNGQLLFTGNSGSGRNVQIL